MSIRERLARDRAERDAGPAHHEGIPVNRDRDRDRENAPVIRDRETAANHRDRFERDSSFNSRDRDYAAPPPRAERPAAPGFNPEFPAEGFPDVEDEDIFGDAAHPRPLRGHQARRDPSHRASEDDDAPAHPHGEDRGHQRLHGAQEARPDLQDPQGAGQAERPDVRRGDARGPARRLRLPAQPRLQLPPLPRRHLRLAQPDPPFRPEDRRHRLRARSGRPRRTSATSPCCGSRRSTSKTPTS